jgi:hypothetical protein
LVTHFFIGHKGTKKKIGHKGTKKKSHLNVIRTEAQYANYIEQQQVDGIQETPGTYTCN